MPWSYQYDWSVYHRIPDNLAEAYLKRLGMEQDTPSREYLDRLVETHQRTIPFENLDTVLWDRPVSLEPDRMMEKILLRHRGGYCFELNGLFSILLGELGFRAILCPCRQLRHAEPCPVPATHCCVLVFINERTLFCDVGYGGPMPRGSMELAENLPQTIWGETFIFQKNRAMPGAAGCEESGHGWVDLIRCRSDGSRLPLISIAPVHAYLCDFYGASLLRSTGDTRYGTLHVSVNTQDGHMDLTDHTLRIRSGASLTESAITDETLPHILWEYFRIRDE